VLWHSSVVSSTSGVHRQPRVSRATATRGKLLLLAEPLDWILTSRHAARAQSATIALRAVILQVWIENERDLTVSSHVPTGRVFSDECDELNEAMHDQQFTARTTDVLLGAVY
jgi:hypothetical protein